MQQKLFPLLGILPWECAMCRRVLLKRSAISLRPVLASYSGSIAGRLSQSAPGQTGFDAEGRPVEVGDVVGTSQVSDLFRVKELNLTTRTAEVELIGNSYFTVTLPFSELVVGSSRPKVGGIGPRIVGEARHPLSAPFHVGDVVRFQHLPERFLIEVIDDAREILALRSLDDSKGRIAARFDEVLLLPPVDLRKNKWRKVLLESSVAKPEV